MNESKYRDADSRAVQAPLSSRSICQIHFTTRALIPPPCNTVGSVLCHPSSPRLPPSFHAPPATSLFLADVKLKLQSKYSHWKEEKRTRGLAGDGSFLWELFWEKSVRASSSLFVVACVLFSTSAPAPSQLPPPPPPPPPRLSLLLIGARFSVPAPADPH